MRILYFLLLLSLCFFQSLELRGQEPFGTYQLECLANPNFNLVTADLSGQEPSEFSMLDLGASDGLYIVLVSQDLHPTSIALQIDMAMPVNLEMHAVEQNTIYWVGEVASGASNFSLQADGANIEALSFPIGFYAFGEEDGNSGNAATYFFGEYLDYNMGPPFIQPMQDCFEFALPFPAGGSSSSYNLRFVFREMFDALRPAAISLSYEENAIDLLAFGTDDPTGILVFEQSLNNITPSGAPIMISVCSNQFNDNGELGPAFFLESISLTDDEDCCFEVLDIQTVEPSCDSADGMINFQLSLDSGPYTVDYAPLGEQSQQIILEYAMGGISIGDLAAGTYNVAIADSEGCEITISPSVILNAPDACCDDLSFTYESFNPSECGVNDGYIEFSASGSTGLYEYSLDGGEIWFTSAVFNDLMPGVYDLAVRTPDNDCVLVDPVSLTLAAPDGISIEAVNTIAETCNESADGQIIILAVSEEATLQYSIDGGNTYQDSNIFEGLNAGIYEVFVTIGTACTIEHGEVMVDAGTALELIEIASENIVCLGDGSGEISIFASAGEGVPLEYSIDGGQSFSTENVFTGLDPGTYDIVVQTAEGCSESGQAGIEFNGADELEFSIDFSENTGCGEEDGFIQFSASGGLPPYQYSIDAGEVYQTQPLFENLGGGFYELYVKDENNCIGVYEAGILSFASSESPTVSDVLYSNPSCFGESDGTITIVAGGGSGVLEYSVDGGSTYSSANTVSDLSSGLYVIMVRDDQGCEVTYENEILLLDPDQLSNITIEIDQLVDCESGSASIEIFTVGGTGFLQYSIDGGETYSLDNAFLDLSAGIYNVKVKDENNCGLEYSENPVVIEEPGSFLDIEVLALDLSSCLEPDGQIIITATGGMDPIQYSIDNGATYTEDNVFSGLSGGSYEILVQDGAGCEAAYLSTVNLLQPDDIEIVSVETSDLACAGDASGAMTILASGGVEPLEYSLNGEDWQSSNQFSDLDAGSYTVWVRDDLACEVFSSDFILLEEPTAVLVANVSTVDLSCPGANDGALTIFAAGGSGALTYSIDAGQNFGSSTVFTDLGPGAYSILVQDESECTIDVAIPVEIFEAATPEISVSIINTSDCATDNGSIEISVEDAVEPLNYSIDNGQNFSVDPFFGDLGGGIYQLIVRDGNFCDYTYGDVELLQGSDIVFSSIPQVTQPDCAGLGGAIEIVVAGGSEPYTYSVDGGQTFQDTGLFDNLPAGQYEIQVIDSADCLVNFEGPIVLQSPESFEITNVLAQPISCEGDPGTIQISATVAGLSYSIDGGENFQTEGTFAGLSAGSYSIVVQDADACQQSYAGNPVLLGNEEGCGVISGIVFIDADGDTEYDAGEATVSGAIITISNQDGIVSILNTEADGSYVSGTAVEGNYMVSIDVNSVPANLSLVTPNFVNVTVGGINPAVADFAFNTDPITGEIELQDDIATTDYGTTVEVDVLENDGIEGLAIIDFAETPNGEISLTEDGNISFTPSDGFTGVVSIEYTAQDPDGNVGTATLTITVGPLAVDDYVITLPGTPVTFNPLSNDLGTGLTVIDFTIPDGGELIVDEDGEFTFIPADGFEGSVTFIYTIQDENGNTSTAIGTVEITFDIPAAPMAVDDSYTTTAGESITLNVMDNDNGVAISIESLVPPANAVTIIEGDVIDFTPEAGFTGTITFTYTIVDAAGQTDSAIVTVLVEADPTAIDAVDDSAETDSETVVEVLVLDNDTGEGIYISSFTQPAFGGEVLVGQEGLIFVPDPNFVGTAVFQYSISDVQGNFDTALVTITVFSSEGPDAIDDLYTTVIDTPITVDLMENDSGLGIFVSDLSPVIPGGGAILNEDGTITFVPEQGFTGLAVFTYTLEDQNGLMDMATVTVNVLLEANEPPCIDTLYFCTGPLQTVPVCFEQCDPNGDPSSIVDVQTTFNCSIFVTEDLCFNYTPLPEYFGLDSVSVTICDNQNPQACSVSTVFVLTQQAGVPSAQPVDDFYSTPNNQNIVIDPLSNDEGELLSIAGLTQPSEGAVVSLDGEEVTLTPIPDYEGTIQFEYEIQDFCGDTAAATITVEITSPIDDPVNAVEDVFNTLVDTPLTLDVLSNDTGNGITITEVTQPAFGGTVQILDGALLFTPEEGFTGLVVFEYTITDENGATDTAAVSITVEELPDPECDTTAYFTTLCTQPVTPEEICFDFCTLEGDSIEVVGVTALYSCSIDLEDNPPECFGYTALPGSAGLTNELTVVACNEFGVCDTAYVEVYVGCFPPLATNDTATAEDESIFIDVLANDSDPCYSIDTLSTVALTQPLNGTLEPAEDGGFNYLPNEGFVGTDSYTYQVCNPCIDLSCDTATVTITVLDITPPADILAVLDVTSTPFETPVEVDVLANDSGEDLSIESFTQPVNGSVSLGEDGTTLVYTPNEGFSGGDFFFYTIIDAEGNTDTTVVNIEVLEENAENQPPSIIGDVFEIDPNEVIELPVLDNDSDPEGGELIITGVIGPEDGGTISFNEDSTALIFTPDPDYIGEVEFEYIACDDAVPPICDTATVVVSVGTELSNNPPQANNDEVTISNLDEFLVIGVCGNDLDIDGNALSVTVLVPPAFGTVEQEQDDESGCSLIYTPNEFIDGLEDIFSYLLCDDGNPELCDTAFVSIDYVLIPAEISAEPDVQTTNFEEAITIDVLANDEGDNLSIISFTQPANGTVTFNVDSTQLIYTPNEGYEGDDFFFYTIQDGEGNVDSTVVNITVLPDEQENLPPVANNDTFEQEEYEIMILDVLENDSDPEGGLLTITTVIGPDEGGTVTISEDGQSLVFEPDSGFVGNINFDYVVCDEEGLCDTASVAIALGGEEVSNNPPIGVEDNFDMLATEDFIIIDVCGNDSDPDGDNIFVSIIGMPMFGELSIDEADTTGCSMIYTLLDSDAELDAFTYLLCDDGDPVLCDTVAVTITIFQGSGEVELNPDVVQTPFETSVSIDVLLNDNSDFPLTITSFTLPENGTVEFDETGTMLIYTPNDGFSGSDFFFYEACDEEGNCESTLVSITVLPEDAVNLPPTANTDLAITEAGLEVIIPVLDNDSDPENQLLTITFVGEPLYGTISYNEDSTELIYLPNDGVDMVEDSFIYVICDPGELCDTAVVWVAIGMEPSNSYPIAENDEVVTPFETPILINICDNDSDPDIGQLLTVTIVAEPAFGTIELLNDTWEEGECWVEYTPNEGYSGQDVFVYILCDDGSPALCDTAFVSITVEEEIVEPETINAQPDIAITSINEPILIDVLANDEGENLTITGFSNPGNGTVIFTVDGQGLIYTPVPGFVGTDYFEYYICDDIGQCDTALVAVIVQPESITNVPPSGISDAYCFEDDQPNVIDVLENDEDAFGGDALILESFTQGAFGTITQEGQQLLYTPVPGSTECDLFEYVVCDNGEPQMCDTVQVEYCIENCDDQNDPPFANSDEAMVQNCDTVQINILSNDEDPNGDNLIVDFVTNPAIGSIELLDGVVTYIPDSTYVGVDYLIYTLCDDGVPPYCVNGAVTIMVSACPEDSTEVDTTVVAVDDMISAITGEVIAIPILNNDTLSHDYTLIEIITDPIDGNTATVVNGEVQYVAALGFEGEDSLQYVVCIEEYCDTAWVYITVGPQNPPEVNCDSLLIASGISPNGDGIQDVLVIQDLYECYPANELRIYNRWGTEVYKAIGYGDALVWDGTWQESGDPLPDGTYFYVLVLDPEDSSLEPRDGFIELRR